MQWVRAHRTHGDDLLGLEVGGGLGPAILRPSIGQSITDIEQEEEREVRGGRRLIILTLDAKFPFVFLTLGHGQKLELRSDSPFLSALMKGKGPRSHRWAQSTLPMACCQTRTRARGRVRDDVMYVGVLCCMRRPTTRHPFRHSRRVSHNPIN